jgi:hypothetical protein
MMKWIVYERKQWWPVFKVPGVTEDTEEIVQDTQCSC